MIGWITAIFTIVLLVVLILLIIDFVKYLKFLDDRFTKYKIMMFATIISIFGISITSIIWGYNLSSTVKELYNASQVVTEQ